MRLFFLFLLLVAGCTVCVDTCTDPDHCRTVVVDANYTENLTRVAIGNFSDLRIINHGFSTSFVANDDIERIEYWDKDKVEVMWEKK